MKEDKYSKVVFSMKDESRAIRRRCFYTYIVCFLVITTCCVLWTVTEKNAYIIIIHAIAVLGLWLGHIYHRHNNPVHCMGCGEPHTGKQNSYNACSEDCAEIALQEFSQYDNQ
jgi:hypothetical protein